MFSKIIKGFEMKNPFETFYLNFTRSFCFNKILIKHDAELVAD